ncbi:MAG: dTMP kinase [Streptosporangiaceae bacterium]
MNTAKPGVLRIGTFRRLWITLWLSSLGDWLSVLALTALARSLASDGYTSQAYAIGAVLIVRLLPSVLLAPLAGALADRLDRRLTMVVADVLRFGLLLSVPLVGSLGWLLGAAFLAEFTSLFWRPARDSLIPSAVPADRVGRARQVSRLTVYGAAPAAGLLFAGLALLSRAFELDENLALYVNAAIFLISAVYVFVLRSGPREHISVPSRIGQVIDGWSAADRGLIAGIVGLVTAIGVVMGAALLYVGAMHGGDAGYGALFTALCAGLAFGLFTGPRMLRGFSRARLFGLAVVFAAFTLVLVALIHDLAVVVMLVGVLGWAAGVAWAASRVVGSDFFEALVRVVLLVVLGVAPLAAGALGRHLLEIGDASYGFDGTNGVLLIGALICLLAGIAAYRQVDDRRAIPLSRDLYGALRGVPYVPEVPVQDRGLFIAFEGGEGSGKTTQSRLLAIWLRDLGFDVVTTREPGATKVGMRLRAILLDKETVGLCPRAETLLYAADRAQHVDTVIRPALVRGSVVVTDRFVDSTLAYQGFGRELPVGEIAVVNSWATGQLMPDLTILLDVSPSVGLNRFNSPADRIESLPEDFHERVSQGFRDLAAAEPHRYLAVDASLAPSEITRQIQDRVLRILPDPVPAAAEDITSTFPAITDA